MLTVEALRQYGANVDEGLSRCMGKEDFYIRMVNMALNDTGFDRLKEALNANDIKAAFEAAHSLKGVLGNLALTPLFTPASELTELLRAGKEADYNTYLNTILEEKEKLAVLAKQ